VKQNTHSNGEAHAAALFTTLTQNLRLCSSVEAEIVLLVLKF